MATEQHEVAVRRAVARRADLQREIDEIDLFLSLYKKFSEATGSDASSDVSIVEDQSLTEPPSHESSHLTAPSPLQKPPRGMSQEDTERISRDILLKNGRPLGISDLIQRIRETGRIIGGKDEAANLKTKLWRAKGRIGIISGAGYWPTDVACPSLGYDPASEA